MRVYDERGRLLTTGGGGGIGGDSEDVIGTLLVNGESTTAVQDYSSRILLEQILIVLMEIRDELKERR